MLKKFQIKSLILALFLILGACSHGTVLKDQAIALGEIISAIENALPAGKRKQSHNGRELYSKYFIRNKGGEYIESEGAPTRYFAHITILGDRRPYDIDIEVVQEKRARDGQYDQSGYDQGLARVISRRIEQILHQRREDRNSIDDFKVF